MSIGRERRVLTPAKRASIVGAAVLLGALVLAPMPGSADPKGGSGDKSGSADTPLTLSQAQARVDSLNHQAEVASEQMNTIKVQMKATRERLHSFETDLRRQGAMVDALRRQLIGSALSKYQSGGGLSTSTGFLVAKDPQSYLAGLSNSAVADNEQAGLFTRLTQQQSQLGVQQEQAKSEVDAIAKAKDDLAAQQDELDKKSAAAESILNTLTIEQQQQLLQMSSSSSSTEVSRSLPRVHDIPASGRAEVAVRPRWRRSATRTSTAPPGPTRSTAPASPCTPGMRPASRCRTRRASRQGKAGRLAVRPDAGRPDLLLLADLARRHVHRPRPDRARAAPGTERGGRLHVRDADRRGPSGRLTLRASCAGFAR